MASYKRSHNFSAGPAVLPEEVLLQAQADMLDWNGTGCSVLEVSHRSKEFEELMKKTEKNLRILADVPDNYRVLFLQGGGAMQFSGVPLNLAGLKPSHSADYIVTGTWSKSAAVEASKFCTVNIAASSESDKFRSIPNPSTWSLSDDSSYVYYCENETIHGVEFPSVPDVGPSRVLVSDASSNFLSRAVNVSQHGLIYAAAQKNFGPAGLTAVLVRDDLVGHAQKICPNLLDYKVMADTGSMPNTPHSYGIYIANLVFEWMLRNGGVAAFEAKAAHRADKIYDILDSSATFMPAVPKSSGCRSRVNVPFRVCKQEGVADVALEDKFLADATARSLLQLKGHRSVGGIRASLYNALPDASFEALTSFLQEFPSTL